MDLSTADRMMIQVPMFHCFGMVLAMTASMTHGTTMSPNPGLLSPKRVWTASIKRKLQAFHGVPTMFIAMLDWRISIKPTLATCAPVLWPGPPVLSRLWRDVINKMHMSEICITYGQTEASPATTMSKITDSHRNPGQHSRRPHLRC